jgi:putative sugar O-methyltransferase
MESEYLIERYSALCAAADRHADLGWRSSREDGQKRRFALTAEIVDRFADYVFGGIGFEVQNDFFGTMPSTEGVILRRPEPTAAQRDEHLKKLSANFKAVWSSFNAARVPPSRWLPIITADNVVGGLLLTLTVNGQQILVSAHTLRVAARVFTMRAAFGTVPTSVLEIGGGHGRFVRDVLKLAPETRITYCDLPFNLLLAARYLSRVFPGEVHLAWDDAPIPDTARITVVPPWRLTEIPYPIDVCCNFLSFQHMQADNLAFYGAALQKLGVASIYHMNRLTAYHSGEVALDDYPFRTAYETVFRRSLGATSMIQWSDGVPLMTGSAEQVEEVLRLKV